MMSTSPMNAGKVFICCGIESMTSVPINGLNYSPHPELLNDQPNVYLSMGLTAENVANKFNVSRKEQQEFAIQSHSKAFKAQSSNAFDEEITVIRNQETKVSADGAIRPNTNQEILDGLKLVFDQNGTVTAGNSSGINDGAAATLLMSREDAEVRGIEPLVKVVSWATCGVEPSLMGLGPIQAVNIALEKAGWKSKDVDLFEINEAFAAQSLAVLKTLSIPEEKVNVNGGAIALGHPIVASGTRILVTLIHEMIKRDVKKGLATLCIGGGMGIAMCVER